MLNRNATSWGTALIYWFPIHLLCDKLKEKYAETIRNMRTPVFSYLPNIEGADEGIEFILPSAISKAESQRKLVYGNVVPSRFVFPRPGDVESVHLCRKHTHSDQRANEILKDYPTGTCVPGEIWRAVNETLPGFSRAYPMEGVWSHGNLDDTPTFELKWENPKLRPIGFATLHLPTGVYIRVFPVMEGQNQSRSLVHVSDICSLEGFSDIPATGSTNVCTIRWLMASDRRVYGLAFPLT